MKFMKLGSRPDTFYTSEAIRYVSSELPSDLIIQVQNTIFSLHKFPLLSKCSLLRKLCSSNPQIVQLPDFPGGSNSFELCAKFCYGITITLSAYNLVSARCASEYLQMTEEVEKGNLAQMLESFFTSCILTGWRDTVVLLRTTSELHSWSEDLNITNRCVEAIASKIISSPSKISYSRSGNKWWGDDLTELGIDLFHRLLTAVGSELPPALIGKLVDRYLQVVKDLSVSEFVGIAEGIPGIERVDHDDLYKAIDTYLQSHPELCKSERRRLCRALDCAKLSFEACTHAAENERLPLRVVVKVLFSENARGEITELPGDGKSMELETMTNKVSPKSTMTSFNTETATMPSDDQCSSVSGSKSSVYTLRMRLEEDDDDDDLYDYFPNGFGKSPRIMSALCVIPTKCK